MQESSVNYVRATKDVTASRKAIVKKVVMLINKFNMMKQSNDL